MIILVDIFDTAVRTVELIGEVVVDLVEVGLVVAWIQRVAFVVCDSAPCPGYTDCVFPAVLVTEEEDVATVQGGAEFCCGNPFRPRGFRFLADAYYSRGVIDFGLRGAVIHLHVGCRAVELNHVVAVEKPAVDVCGDGVSLRRVGPRAVAKDAAPVVRAVLVEGSGEHVRHCLPTVVAEDVCAIPCPVELCERIIEAAACRARSTAAFIVLCAGE